MWVESVHGEEIQRTVLCGYLAALSVYPLFSIVTVLVATYPSIFYNISGQFQVQDKNLLSTRSMTKVSQNGHLSSKLCNTIQNKWVHEIIELEVPKRKRIQTFAHADTSRLLVLDGPENQSPCVNSRGNVFHLTSFRSFIVHLQTYCRLHCLHVNYTAVDLPLIKLLVRSADTLSLPSKMMCSVLPCVLYCFTNFSYQVNITVLNLSYEGKESEICKYAGFATGQYLHETLNNSFRENVILCETSDPQFELAKSFYSSLSVLYVQLYQFQQYAELNLKLKVASPSKKSILKSDDLLHGFLPVQFSEPLHAKNWVEVQFHQKHLKARNSTEAEGRVVLSTTNDQVNGRFFIFFVCPEMFVVSWTECEHYWHTSLLSGVHLNVAANYKKIQIYAV